uniref:Peptidase A1 domain-containing protein n=1 Tax=Gongylonema pulchrum TaxID=637853 RepID=A0A183D7B5_9BILA
LPSEYLNTDCEFTVFLTYDFNSLKPSYSQELNLPLLYCQSPSRLCCSSENRPADCFFMQQAGNRCMLLIKESNEPNTVIGGIPLHREYCVVYDAKNLKIGFASPLVSSGDSFNGDQQWVDV